ncbi:putative FMN/FAD exporter YeeO [Pseudidiomarina piscicola]|uniref:Putative FMN/FAD exporter YeeO n=1 Tax=Pseudidiomarina piscicola TaxID=2614830 RepID=A0A6S6WJX1_9GAMM|nr:MATE family efflux transporter [Pseudidiomarina piscicola]CAB0149740.1 putative FMN/FAD exporter YeeO [Pseudidiomarina piscicola]VZT39188.1 putative FMN/FAD exporter YeeO [Pseudomonas aeruginosa]
MASAVSAKSLTSDPIPTTLWQMTWPVVIGVLTLISFNVVDTFFVGLLGTDPLAAVSFTFPVTFSVVSLAIGLGIGTSAVLARKRGAGHEEQARFDGLIALGVSALLVAILSVLGYLFMQPIFAALQAQERLLPLIEDYMLLWFAGATLLVIPMVGNAVLRSSGDTRTPSIIMASGGLLNAVFDPILIFGLGPIPAMGVQGAALASVLSWSIGTVLVLWYLHYKGLIRFKIPERAHPLNSAREILSIGLPAAGANMLTPLAMAVMTAIIAAYGAPAVAAFGVGSRIESLASVMILALSMSLPPLISQNLGAMQFERVREAYITALRSVLVVQLVIYLVLLVGAPYIANLFTDDPEVARLIRLFIYIMPLGYGMQGIIILTNSSFNAMHEPMSALALSIVRLFVMFVPLSYVGSLIADIQGLFIGGVIANVLTAAIAWRWFQRGMRKQRNEEVA